jgi:hypothetical protein
MNTPTMEVTEPVVAQPEQEIPIAISPTPSRERESTTKHANNRKFPGPSLKEQRDFLNGFGREEYYRKYVR